MMKTIQFVLVFLYINILTAQSKKNLDVEYKLFYNLTESTSNELKKFVPNLTNESGNIFFRLMIQDSISLFTEANGLKAKNLSTLFGIGKTQYSNPVYTNLKEKKIFYQGSTPAFFLIDSDEYLIVRNLNSDWILVDVQKKIDGITCLKAETIDFYWLHGKKYKYDVTAWYAPQFANSFGPTFYNGLPGLILEVSYLDATIIATKINVLNKNKKILKPLGKEIISVEKFEEIKLKRLEEIKLELDK